MGALTGFASALLAADPIGALASFED